MTVEGRAPGEMNSELEADIGIVLVRPTEEGNVGSVARAMANMGLRRLTLVEPAAPIGPVARAFATSGREILDSARRVTSLAEAVGAAGRVVGTTSGRERTLDRDTIDPRELGTQLAAAHPGAAVVEIVFGPEKSGLTREELSHCGSWVSIPAASDHPTLNLGQAVLLVAYELHRARQEGRPTETAADPPAPAAELEGLFSQWSELLRRAGFARDTSFGGVERDLRALLHRAAPRWREVRVLRGIARRLGHRLEQRTAARPAGGPGSGPPERP